METILESENGCLVGGVKLSKSQNAIEPKPLIYIHLSRVFLFVD